jgi:hypothetical protein
VRLAALVRAIGDCSGVTVLVGVRVAEGVAVGIVGVMVGRAEAVAVGRVAVGNGPRRAPSVIATAVFVPSALLCALARPRIGFPKIIT